MHMLWGACLSLMHPLSSTRPKSICSTDMTLMWVQSFQVLTRDFLPKVPKAARTFIFKSLRARALDTIYRMVCFPFSASATHVHM